MAPQLLDRSVVEVVVGFLFGLRNNRLQLHVRTLLLNQLLSLREPAGPYGDHQVDRLSLALRLHHRTDLHAGAFLSIIGRRGREQLLRLQKQRLVQKLRLCLTPLQKAHGGINLLFLLRFLSFFFALVRSFGFRAHEHENDIQNVEQNEAQGFPELDFRIEKDKNKVDDAAQIEQAITKERATVNDAIREHCHAAGDNRGHKHTCTHVCTHTDLRVAGKHGNNQGKHIRRAIAESEECDSCDARRDVELFNDGVHDKAKVVICCRCQKREQQHQNDYPEDREPDTGAFRTTILKISTIGEKENTNK